MATSRRARATTRAPSAPDVVRDRQVADPPSVGTTPPVAPLDPFPYEFIAAAASRPSDLLPSLLETLRTDPSAGRRLVAAWAIGAIGRRSSLAPLRAAYAAEAEPNARANIAWALLRCSSWRPSRRDIETLLDDPYHPVVLIALKALGSLSARVRRDPVRLYVAHDDVLLRQALLDEVHRFSISAKGLKRFLLGEIRKETSPWLRAALLRALSRVDPANAAALARSLSESAASPMGARFLRSAFVAAVAASFESRWSPELSALYREIDDPERRWDIIAATAAPGGPAGQTALVEMEATETDEELRSALRALREALLITPVQDIGHPRPSAETRSDDSSRGIYRANACAGDPERIGG